MAAKNKKEIEKELKANNSFSSGRLASGLAGFADELSFGLATKADKELFEKLKKENPGFYTGGRIASYLTPGLGQVKAGKFALKSAKEAGPILKALRTIGTPQQAVTLATEGAGKLASKGVESAVKKLISEGASKSFISKMLASAAKYGTTAGTQVAAQGTIRKGLGTGDEEGLADTVESSAKVGAGLSSKAGD